jgi:hypothetical protein
MNAVMKNIIDKYDKQAGPELCQALAKLVLLTRSCYEQIPGGWLGGW